MIMSPFLIWVAIAVVFVVAEIFTFGFILVFFGVGALAAGLCALIFNMALGWQIVVFAIVSILTLVLLRRISVKTFRGNQTNNHIENNFHNSMVGKTVIVTKVIQPPAPGEIKFGGSFWIAVADENIAEGQTVKIIAHERQDVLVFKVKAVSA